MSLLRARERTGTPCDWLVVGLGNPGADYAGTRHNVGEQAVSVLADRHGGRLKAGKERALSCEVRFGPVGVADQQLVALAFPQTFMNLSGESVRMLVKRYGVVDPSKVIVVHDELDVGVGDLRLKFDGGTAGHNGLKSVQAHLNSSSFIRVRIGIGRPPGQQPSVDYVLKRPGKSERTELDVSIQLAADAVERIVSLGFERAQNEFNTRR